MGIRVVVGVGQAGRYGKGRMGWAGRQGTHRYGMATKATVSPRPARQAGGVLAGRGC